MLEVLEKQISAFKSLEDKFNHLREFLQVLTLKNIYDLGYFRNLSFIGGTALRILYDLRRFSEDLDFSLATKQNYDFQIFSKKLEKRFSEYGLDVSLVGRDKRTVQSLEVRFNHILFQLGLSPHKDENLMIKVEIDANPPAGAKAEMSLVNKTYIFTILHHDLPSLYATKLHACFYRKYTKGRDFYDLLWYLGKKIEPNYLLLNNAITQTHGGQLGLNDKNFHAFLLDRLRQVNFVAVKKDVQRFIEDKDELKLLQKEIFLQAASIARKH